MPNIIDLEQIFEQLAAGREPLEEPSALGGIFVDEETLGYVADLETVADFAFAFDMKETISVMLQVIRNAAENGDDPITAARDWLDGWLDLLAQGSMAS